MKQFNIIGKCLPKCYLIARLSLLLALNLSCNSVPQTNKPQLWQRFLISYLLLPHSLHNCARPFYYATRRKKYCHARFPVWKQWLDEQTSKFVDRFITDRKVSIQVARLLFVSAWSKAESWRGSDSRSLRPIIKCNSLASCFYWACTSNKPVGAS